MILVLSATHLHEQLAKKTAECFAVRAQLEQLRAEYVSLMAQIARVKLGEADLSLLDLDFTGISWKMSAAPPASPEPPPAPLPEPPAPANAITPPDAVETSQLRFKMDGPTAAVTETNGAIEVAAGWKFPGEVNGWLTNQEGRILAHLASAKDVLEIGTYCGLSTICMAQTARSICCVDPFDGRGTPTLCRNTLGEFERNINRYKLSHKVRVLGMAFNDAWLVLQGESQRYDLVFIDGAHDFASVMGDAILGMKLLRPGGLLAFHDYGMHPDGRHDVGVQEAVGKLIAIGAELLEVVGTVAVVRPAAKVEKEPALNGERSA